MSGDSTETRIYFRMINPNPLFTEWLEFWLNQAEEKDSMKKCSLAKALDSLKKYPLVLYSGTDCAVLEGFGKSICAMIDKQLAVYRNNNPNGLPNEKEMNIKEKSILFDVKTAIESKRKKKEKEDFFSKFDDTLEAILNDPNNCIDEDIEMATEAPTTAPVINEYDFMPEKILLKSGSFKIILLVDTQETNGKTKVSLDTTRKALTDLKVNFEIRRLSVGDFLWICRDEANDNQEAVLPFIIERKRMDDFASSIKDGRFHEQKFRLRACGLKNTVYLIENRGSNSHCGLPLSTLMQAATNTQVQNDFLVKFTNSTNDSMLYLAVMTNLLAKMFLDKNLVISTKNDLKKLPNDYYDIISEKAEVELMEFKEFAETTGKMRNFTVRDIFLRQLVQLKTLSIEKALAITEIYPTPKSLLLAYGKCFDENEAINLLANIPCGKLKKPLGYTISRILYNFYKS